MSKFNKDFSNLPFINLTHDILTSRIYKRNGSLFVFTASLTELIPYGSDSIFEMSKYIMGLLEPCLSHINLHFGYPKGSLSKKQHNKLNGLLKETELDQKVLIRFITLLSSITKV